MTDDALTQHPSWGEVYEWSDRTQSDSDRTQRGCCVRASLCEFCSSVCLIIPSTCRAYTMITGQLGA